MGDPSEADPDGSHGSRLAARAAEWVCTWPPARTKRSRKRWAIKLVRRGWDTDFVVQRFRSERQLLATLDHPNIARRPDGGANAEGLPYFVMEYIQGEPIDQYYKPAGLNTAARLKLVQSVCAGVHYARQNLVEQLSEDLRWHYDGLPVIARPDTPGCRVAKFVGRHKAGAVAAALILLAVAAGVVATVRQARRAARERDKAGGAPALTGLAAWIFPVCVWWIDRGRAGV